VTAAKAATPDLDPDRRLTLASILGHAPARDFLLRALAEHRLPQALLLTGPPGVGKKTLAWALIRQIAARGDDPESHRGSLKVVRNSHPDVHVCDASASVSGQITIDVIREMEDWTATSPLEAPRKIVLISPAEAMNLPAANALLKLLEEPPRHVLLILTASDPARLLPTIRSRCTALQLEPLPTDELVPWLKQHDALGDDQAALVARLAEGRPGRALAILDSDLVGTRSAILEELELLRQHGFAVVFRVADRLGTLGPDPAATLDAALLLLRDALLIRLRAPGVLNADLAPQLAAFADDLSPDAILAAADRVERASQELAGFYTPQARAHFLETLVVDIGRRLRQS
jgi:DNA polymerase III subunit delta'